MEETLVKTITLEKLIEDYNIKHLDLLQIDTEGYDYEILKMLDFNRLKPTVINYENEHLSKQDRVSCEQLLQINAYSLFDHKGKYGDTCAFL